MNRNSSSQPVESIATTAPPAQKGVMIASSLLSVYDDHAVTFLILELTINASVDKNSFASYILNAMNFHRTSYPMGMPSGGETSYVLF